MMFDRFMPRLILATCGALLWAAPGWALTNCPPMTNEISRTHTTVQGGNKLVPAGQSATVELKANIHPDGSADINIVRSSGISALNDLARDWVRSHWRWPRGCAPGAAEQIQLGFPN